MGNPSLKAISLTHVRYHRGDQLGHFLAWVSLVPVFISLAGFVAHFLFRRELQGIFFSIGLVVSQFVNGVVKMSVQEARPATCAVLEMCDSHGWPSSHSQFMFFFATYYTLLCMKSSRRSEMGLIWSLAFLTMYSRVYLGYHTIGQVFAGAALGIFVGISWFWFVNRIMIHHFPAIEESTLGRMLYIKDTSHIDNVLKFEYDNARAARKNQNPKMN